MSLTINEKIEIVRLVGDGVRSFRQAAMEFNRRHPDKRIHHNTVARINNAFDQTGTLVAPPGLHRNRIIANDQIILNYFNVNPKTSIREASANLNISKNRIWRCLKKNRIKPYKPKFLQTLEDGDNERRLEYCLWLQGEYLNNRNFLKYILYTDEATFTTNGVVTSQNIRMWSDQNPHWIVQCKRQYSQKVNVWCGILNERIIGPFFFDGNLNGAAFLHFLENELTEEIDQLPLNEVVNLHMQLDGAPIHNTALVRNWLNQNYPNRWIGRNSPLIHWPPRSPDLSPLDFFFWGTIKNKVYVSRPQTVDGLRDRIVEACRGITREQLRRVVENNRRRIEKCISVNGGLIEQINI